MSLIAAGTESTAPVIITNALFFPDLSLTEFRDSMRLESTVTNDRAVHALEVAMYDANSQLATWATEKIIAGVEKITDVAQPSWYPEGAYLRLYLRAVWSLARANLVERYRDYDSSGHGHDRSDALDNVTEDYRRDAAWALADIIGRRRTTVDLI